jgi:hypothetical protein
MFEALASAASVNATIEEALLAARILASYLIQHAPRSGPITRIDLSTCDLSVDTRRDDKNTIIVCWPSESIHLVFVESYCWNISSVR